MFYALNAYERYALYVLRTACFCYDSMVMTMTFFIRVFSLPVAGCSVLFYLINVQHIYIHIYKTVWKWRKP